MKILILIMASPKNSVEYKNIAECSRNTWCSIKHDNIDILFCYGDNNNSEPYIKDDELHLTINEDGKNLLNRTIEAFEFLNINFNYDFILRTNISSYFNLDLLYEKILTLPKDNLYAGYHTYHNGSLFASGAGYIISKDVLKYIISNKNSIDFGLCYSGPAEWPDYDDVTIGKLLSHIPIIHLDRIDYTTPEQISTIETTYQGHYHYRCKNWPDRSGDIIVMNKLFELLK